MQSTITVGGYLLTLQTANADYLKKIQLSGFSAYPDGSPSQLIRIRGVLLYIITYILRDVTVQCIAHP